MAPSRIFAPISGALMRIRPLKAVGLLCYVRDGLADGAHAGRDRDDHLRLFIMRLSAEGNMFRATAALRGLRCSALARKARCPSGRCGTLLK